MDLLHKPLFKLEIYVVIEMARAALLVVFELKPIDGTELSLALGYYGTSIFDFQYLSAMKTLWLISLLFPVSIYAQRSGSDEYITRIADSLINIKSSIDTNASYQQIRDSVERVMAARWVEEDVKAIGYCWPCRAKERKEVLTYTYRYLLENKYGISPVCISSGCVDQYYFTAYDSVMNETILSKMGS